VSRTPEAPAADAQQIAVYGSGGFGREVAWLAQSCSSPEKPIGVVCHIDDDEGNWGRVLNGIPVMGVIEAHRRFPDALVAGGIGSPRGRESAMEKAAASGFGFATLIHPNVCRSQWIDFGVGAVVCAGNIITVNIRMSQHVQINLDCSIGHDVILEDFATLAPGVQVSGWVHFGKRVYAGTGAVFIHGTEDAPLIIGDDAVIGAGAVVINGVPPGVTVAGVPARPLRSG
jgi:sugar O-acyltransferase (sialic acid O-acetyltransferase NeuD family)